MLWGARGPGRRSQHPPSQKGILPPDPAGPTLALGLPGQTGTGVCLLSLEAHVSPLWAPGCGEPAAESAAQSGDPVRCPPGSSHSSLSTAGHWLPRLLEDVGARQVLGGSPLPQCHQPLDPASQEAPLVRLGPSAGQWGRASTAGPAAALGPCAFSWSPGLDSPQGAGL